MGFLKTKMIHKFIGLKYFSIISPPWGMGQEVQRNIPLALGEGTCYLELRRFSNRFSPAIGSPFHRKTGFPVANLSPYGWYGTGHERNQTHPGFR